MKSRIVYDVGVSLVVDRVLNVKQARGRVVVKHDGKALQGRADRITDVVLFTRLVNVGESICLLVRGQYVQQSFSQRASH